MIFTATCFKIVAKSWAKPGHGLSISIPRGRICWRIIIKIIIIIISLVYIWRTSPIFPPVFLPFRYMPICIFLWVRIEYHDWQKWRWWSLSRDFVCQISTVFLVFCLFSFMFLLFIPRFLSFSLITATFRSSLLFTMRCLLMFRKQCVVTWNNFHCIK